MKLQSLSNIALALCLCAIASSFAAQDEPGEDMFSHSSHDLGFQVPAGFELATKNRRYLKEDTHEVPRFQRVWQHGSDTIIINVIVIPDAAWQQKTSKQLFADGMDAMLKDPTLKLVSERSYELDGCPAKSITCFYDGGDATSQRMDCFLSKPNMYMVAYTAPKASSWDDAACKAFFQSISLKPKK